MESIPYRVVTSPRLPGVVTPGPAPARFRAPSTTSLRLAPCAAGTSTPAAVPLSGFHSLPAVCQHTRASRPCFMPQTVRGVLPSERCSSLGSRAPLGAALLPCGSPPQYLRCDARGRVLQVSPDCHACAWFAWAPPGAHASFSAGRSLSSPTRWAPLTGTTPFLQLRPLRSLDPRASPYSRTPVARRPRAVALLGFRPSRALSRPEPRALA